MATMQFTNGETATLSQGNGGAAWIIDQNGHPIAQTSGGQWYDTVTGETLIVGPSGDTGGVVTPPPPPPDGGPPPPPTPPPPPAPPPPIGTSPTPATFPPGNMPNVTEALRLNEGVYTFPVRGNGEFTKIRLVNDSYLPNHFIRVEWKGNFVPKSRK